MTNRIYPHSKLKCGHIHTFDNFYLKIDNSLILALIWLFFSTTKEPQLDFNKWGFLLAGDEQPYLPKPN